MSYISSNANRFYTALESAYGSIATVTASNRIPAVKLAVRQQLEVTDRKDKTGSRTFAGLPAGGRRRTKFELRDLSDQLAAGGWRPGVWSPVSSGDGGNSLTVRRGNGGLVQRWEAWIRRPPRAERGPGSDLRRRDPVCIGDR